jgi:hypothetical protein
VQAKISLPKPSGSFLDSNGCLSSKPWVHVFSPLPSSFSLSQTIHMLPSINPLVIPAKPAPQSRTCCHTRLNLLPLHQAHTMFAQPHHSCTYPSASTRQQTAMQNLSPSPSPCPTVPYFKIIPQQCPTACPKGQPAAPSLFRSPVRADACVLLALRRAGEGDLREGGMERCLEHGHGQRGTEWLKCSILTFTCFFFLCARKITIVSGLQSLRPRPWGRGIP